MNIGFVSDSGAEGFNTPDWNFSALMRNLEFNNSTIGKFLFNRTRAFTDISAGVRAGVGSAIMVRLIKGPILPRFKTGVFHP